MPPSFIIEAPDASWDTSERSQFFLQAITDIGHLKWSELIKKAYKMASGRIRLIITQKQEIPPDVSEDEKDYFIDERTRYAMSNDWDFVVSPKNFIILRFTWDAIRWLVEDETDDAVDEVRKQIQIK